MSALLDETARGVYVIVPTPFFEDGRLDLESADRLVDFYLEEGVQGLTILGVMGEAPKLSLEEQILFTRRILARCQGRLPVVVGVSNPGLDNLADLAQRSMDAGAAGVMVAGHANLKTDVQVEAYFRQVATRLGVNVPICLQDYPPTTGVYFSVSVINSLIETCPSIVMFKHEDCPGHRKLSQLRDAGESASVRRVSILTGNGGLYVPQELLRGADGIMTGFAFAGMLVDVWRCFRDERSEEGEDLFDLYLPLMRHEQQIGFGLALRKETLRRRGALSSAKTRDPGPSMDRRDHEELTRLLERLKRKLIETGSAMPLGL
ncbi:MAG: dihydrodipicolinate synthase family protein [Kiloniellales bacterium]|nr:dihydrodipicolinate synthase family protein [Kiloniellales bacterium]